jgi:hypothetical protein
MEWMDSFAAILYGIVLRFVIPIGITVLLALFLRRLDARWMKEAEERRLRAHSLGADVRQVRCWEGRDCPPEERDQCPAYIQPRIPCWQLFRDHRGSLKETCLSCEVFLEAPPLLAT